MAALKYWVWFTTLPGLTNRSKLLLLEHFPSPEDIYYAQPEDLPPVEGLSSSQAALLSDKSTDRAEDARTAARSSPQRAWRTKERSHPQ